MKERAIEIDLVETWPVPLLEWAQGAIVDRAEALREGSISGFAEQDAMVWHLVGAYGIQIYHCARLLPHEAESIGGEGLSPLTDALVVERISSAVQHGHLSAAEAGHCHARWRELRESQGQFRCGLVWAVAGRSMLDRHADGLVGFLSSWGGEALFGGPIDMSRALTIGTPSIVVATLQRADYSQAPRGSVAWAVAAAISDDVSPEWRGAEFSILGRVGDVTDVWTPGHPEYDRHAAFPRA